VSFYQVRAEQRKARDVGEELIALCEKTDDRVAQVQAHYGHGVTLYDLVKLDGAQKHLERALTLYDPYTHPIHGAVDGGYGPRVGCWSWLGWVQWARGLPDQALRSVLEGLALAERLGHAFSLTFSHLATAMVHLFRWETEPALVHIEHALKIANDEGFAYQRAVAATLEGWARVMQGRPADAIVCMRDGLAGYATTRTALGRPACMTLLPHGAALTG